MPGDNGVGMILRSDGKSIGRDRRNSGLGIPQIWSSSDQIGRPGPNLVADLVPLNYILADLIPPPKCRFYLNIF